MILVDSNVLIDLIEPDSAWNQWSSDRFADMIDHGPFMNTIVSAEIASRFATLEDLEQALEVLALPIVEIPTKAAWLAGRAYLKWARNGGRRGALLPYIIIGAHASAEGAKVLTRDPRRFRTYFPDLELVCPD